MIKEQQIRTLIEEFLPNESLFIVDLKLSFVKVPGKITITLDGDNGVSIEQCAEISRKLGHHIEEEELITDPYNLEVSSPGLDQPLKFLRQYRKNIGKDVRVLLKNSKELEGKLEEVSEQEMSIREEKKTKNKSKKSYNDELTTLSFEEINKTNILIQF